MINFRPRPGVGHLLLVVLTGMMCGLYLGCLSPFWSYALGTIHYGPRRFGFDFEGELFGGLRFGWLIGGMGAAVDFLLWRNVRWVSAKVLLWIVVAAIFFVVTLACGGSSGVCYIGKGLIFLSLCSWGAFFGTVITVVPRLIQWRLDSDRQLRITGETKRPQV
jgi:hypothetical protein